MSDTATAAPTKALRGRPGLFRALGKNDPPEHIEAGGRCYTRAEILKHDSWAATAIYENKGNRIVCKFNRQQPIFGLPVKWLGRALARREARALSLLADLPNVPAVCPPIQVDGSVATNAVAHDYVLGHPLAARESVGPTFFPTLEGVLREMHRRGMAYVDLHKRENILVGEDGQPYLIDFQISFILPGGLLGKILPWRALLRVLCGSDLYHLSKHVQNSSVAAGNATARQPVPRPWWIRLHRLIAQPFRTCRRQLLVLCGVRSGEGKAHSEQFAEDAVRRELAQTQKPAA
jgi:hypothetical protein